MYFMYVDESGDIGLTVEDSPTPYFILTGLVVHELRWQQYFQQLVNYRQTMRVQYGLKIREEIHASYMINKPGPLARISKDDRFNILKSLASELANMSDISIINIVVDKQRRTTGYDVFEQAWQALIQQFENNINWRNFPGPMNPEEKGLLLPDRTDDKKLT